LHQSSHREALLSVIASFGRRAISLRAPSSLHRSVLCDAGILTPLDLKALSTPPPEYDPDAIELPPLAIGPTTDDWTNQRAQLLDRWLEYLGHGPEVVPLDPQVQQEVDLGFATRSLVSYAVEPDCRVEAYVFVPHLDEPMPSALVFHPTTNDTILQPAGLAPVEEKHYGIKLAQRGFVTISPRNYLWAYMDGPDPEEERTIRATRVDTLNERWPEWTGMGKMVWDGLRAVDYLLVDPERIGTVGHSLGAKEVIYSLALDERLKVGVTSEGGIGIPFSNYDAPWYLGEGIHDRPDLDHHQLVAIAAPRPLLSRAAGVRTPRRPAASRVPAPRSGPLGPEARRSYHLRVVRALPALSVSNRTFHVKRSVRKYHTQSGGPVRRPAPPRPRAWLRRRAARGG